MDAVRATVIAAILLTGSAGCAPAAKQVDDAVDRGRSWAATIKVVAEQWAQARVSLRFVRTTITTATQELERDAEAIRSLDGRAAARLDRVKSALQPVMQAVAKNEPDAARDAASLLPTILQPEPIPPVARPR